MVFKEAGQLAARWNSMAQSGPRASQQRATGFEDVH